MRIKLKNKEKCRDLYRSPPSSPSKNSPYNLAYNKCESSIGTIESIGNRDTQLDNNFKNPSDIDHNDKKNLKTRTILAVIMISGLLLVISLGHFYAAMLIVFIIFQMSFEIMQLKRDDEKDNRSYI